MILLFDSDTVNLHWCKVEGDNFAADKCQLRSDWSQTVAKSTNNFEKIKSIGYFLHNGGEIIKKPASFLSAQNMKELEKCVGFLPEFNDITAKTAGYYIDMLPNLSHILLCDTAFFLDLPAEVSSYAVPYQLSGKGIRRTGRFGLFHSWASKQIEPLIKKSSQRIICVHLDERTDVTAVKDGLPVDSSMGFTPTEGILSGTSCGDIDPTIIFYLHSMGMRFEQINQLLSSQSGFTALTGEKTDLFKVISGKRNVKKDFAREIYLYNVVKYIGSFISMLGGLDAIVFFSEKLEKFQPIISDVCKKFEFLGLKLQGQIDKKQQIWNFADKTSDIKVFGLKINKWRILASQIEALKNKGIKND
jgi:acetate kinase